MTAKQFKGHVRSRFINYMTRSTSKPSNRRCPRLNLPQCSLKLFRIFIRCCCVLWQYFVERICFDRSVVTLYARASIPSYPHFVILLRITYLQLTLRLGFTLTFEFSQTPSRVCIRLCKHGPRFIFLKCSRVLVLLQLDGPVISIRNVDCGMKLFKVLQSTILLSFIS